MSNPSFLSHDRSLSFPHWVGLWRCWRWCPRASHPCYWRVRLREPQVFGRPTLGLGPWGAVLYFSINPLVCFPSPFSRAGGLVASLGGSPLAALGQYSDIVRWCGWFYFWAPSFGHLCPPVNIPRTLDASGSLEPWVVPPLGPASFVSRGGSTYYLVKFW
jgi:hypothetical protein